MFPKYEEITGTHGYKMENFIVFDVPHKGIPFNVFDKIGDYLIEGGNIPKFDENRNISSNLYSDYILIEYNDKNIIDNTVNNIDEIL